MPYALPFSTTFVTFYSFKGGVGRTMSLLNVACILAGRGRRVLMIDFDLEAPGLTTLKDLTRSAAPQAGLVELIHDFLSDPKASPLVDADNRASFHERYVTRLKIPEHLRRLEKGYLDLMPCGRLDDGYMKRLNDIDFRALYSAGVGQPLFKLLKNVIRESELYDYVLVDARTGLSDEGGICTRDLADHICVITGLNRQNVEGTAQFLHRLKASGWNEGEVLFVASPVPSGYEELRDKRLRVARRAFAKAGFTSDFKLRIPYHPRLALDEEPFIYRWTETDLFASYELIQQELRRLANDTPQEALRNIQEAVRQDEIEDALAEARQLYADEPELGTALLSEITQMMKSEGGKFRKQAASFHELWIDLSSEVIARIRYGQYLRLTGSYRHSFGELTSARKSAVKLRARRMIALADFELGVLLQSQGRYEKAVEHLRSARDAAERNTDFVADVDSYLAGIFQQQGRFEEAVALYNEVSGTYGHFGVRIRRYRALLGDISLVKTLQGGLVVGLNMELFDYLEKDIALAEGYVDFVFGTLKMDGPEQALALLDKHWDFVLRYAAADIEAEAHVLRARIKDAMGDTAGAVEDAKVALGFYRRNDVQTQLSREAAELAGAAAS